MVVGTAATAAVVTASASRFFVALCLAKIKTLHVASQQSRAYNSFYFTQKQFVS